MTIKPYTIFVHIYVKLVLMCIASVFYFVVFGITYCLYFILFTLTKPYAIYMSANSP